MAGYLYYLLNPNELRSMLQWKIWHNPVHERNPQTEAASLTQCFILLDKTSRSFSAVIQELNPELLVPICLFYLVLRGLDTIEDDMTIPLPKKERLLRSFHEILDQDGWTFTESGPNEKDRILLEQFHYVITEMKKLKPEYTTVIQDITEKMGNGMADYANNAEHNKNGVNSIKDYELYCHYVAGLVGEGLTRLFVESKLANPALLKRKDLHESMGQFLQQTNIIRDIREDKDDGRRFWPKEVWSKHVDDFDDLFKVEHQEAALRCSSEMVLISLERATDCLYYLAGIRDQSVFNFAAIPQAMAIATLELCFQNPAIFERNVKITKGQACGLMIESSQNLPVLFSVFKRFARKIHKKNDPRDPNFLKISIACGKIEQFIESIFPTQDPKAIVGTAVVPEKIEDLSPEAAEERRLAEEEAKWERIYIFSIVAAVIVMVSGLVVFMAWCFGARFDLMFSQLLNGNLTKPSVEDLREVAESAHGELFATSMVMMRLTYSTYTSQQTGHDGHVPLAKVPDARKRN